MQFLILCLFLAVVSSTFAAPQTPQSVLKSEGYKFVMKDSTGEIYYRPREVKKDDGIVWYSTTRLLTKTTSTGRKHSLVSDYTVMGCKEHKAALLGVHTVPYIGKASYKDLSKKLTEKSFRNFTTLDTKMFKLLCK